MNIPDKIEVPAATAWPIVLASGLTLVFAGFVTAVSVSILGATLVVAGAVGWFREVLPVESLEWAPLVKPKFLGFVDASVDRERACQNSWGFYCLHRR
jgi:hypothetical protein